MLWCAVLQRHRSKPSCDASRRNHLIHTFHAARWLLMCATSLSRQPPLITRYRLSALTCTVMRVLGHMLKTHDMYQE